MDRDSENNKVESSWGDFNPNTMELEAIEQLKQRVLDLDPDMRKDETLLRFLRARDLILKKAEEMLRKSAEWRKENNLDSFASYSAPPALKKDYIVESLGRDLEGYPLLYVPIGRWNIRDRLSDGYVKETREYKFYLLEGVLVPALKGSGKSQVVLIIDLEELSFYKCAHVETMNVCTKFVQDYESNYPERLRTCFIINAPWVFSYAFSILKPWFASKTLEKINILKGEKLHWLPILEEIIPREVLPAHLK